jgi:hypothetical protein
MSGQGVVASVRRLLRELVQSDETRLAHQLRSWASSIPGTVLIAEAPLRVRVRLAGEVRKITFRPKKPFDEFEVVLYDGSGQVRLVWLGRRSIPGLSVGSRLVVNGVVAEAVGERRMLDPEFEFVPDA